MASHIALQQVSIAAHKSQYGIAIFLSKRAVEIHIYQLFQ